MSIIAKSLSGENEVLETLEKIVNSGLEFTLIGGYAVTARGRHRYSVDCDIVAAELGRFKKLLEREGYRIEEHSNAFRDVYGGESYKFMKGVLGSEVSVDIFVRSLVIRQTAATWSFEYLRKYSSPTDVPGIQKAVHNVMVLDKEMLIATKIHPARLQDIQDIVILVDKVDWSKVAMHTKRGRLDEVKKQINFILSRLEDPKLRSDLKSQFEVKGNIENELARTKEALRLVLDGILK